MELFGSSYYGVSGPLIDKCELEIKISPSICHDVAVGTDTRYHIIVLHRYSPVCATVIMPKCTCIKGMRGQIILLRKYGLVQDTRIITKGTCNRL